MTLDQLTQLASRVTDTSIPIYAFMLDELAAFAAAIAAEEREACALLCQTMTVSRADDWKYDCACLDCAAAIRARDTA